MKTLLLCAFSACALLPLDLGAQTAITEHTFDLAPHSKSPPASIAEVAWLAGRWQGEALGGMVEEIWSPPVGGTMMGMYRLTRNGQAVFYELITLSEANGSLLIKLKHFHPNLSGWEEKDETVDFPLVAIDQRAVHFRGMSFHPEGDTLTVYLAIGEVGGEVREEVFKYRRVAKW